MLPRQQIPVILQNSQPTNPLLKQISQNINGSDKLANALQLSANEFKSMVLLNDDHGKFTATALPNRAQLFPIRDFILQDVNGDGKKDIICGGNMYGAEVETVRYDAGVGLLLYGDGKGGYEPASLVESGIFSPYDTRHVLTIRLATAQTPGYCS